MCFSANASFAAAGALSVISLLSIRAAAIAHNKKLIPLAATPLFFALQQACEGVVWITLNNGDTTSILHVVSTQAFLFFASAWWPLWIPLALFIPEIIPKRKQVIRLIGFIGVTTGIALFTSWVFYTTGAQAIGHHIDYPAPNYPFGISNHCIARVVAWLISIGYCTATIVPFFVSSISGAWILGITMSISFIASYLFYLLAFSSVWCFFAAISSALLYLVIKKAGKAPQQ